MSQQELGQRLGQGKLEARTICRNLDRRGLVVTIMKDIGRQRVTNFVAKKFETVSQGAVQYQVLLAIRIKYFWRTQYKYFCRWRRRRMISLLGMSPSTRTPSLC